MADKKKQAEKIPEYMVSEIFVNPARTFGLKNYSSVKLSAGMKLVFEKPVPLSSPLVTEAYERATRKLQEEFRRQLDSFGPKKKQEASTEGGDKNDKSKK